MFDYAGWLERAVAFVRSLDHLPGELGITVEIKPPLSIAEADTFRRSLPFEWPRQLYEFFTAVSGSARCAYHWEPDEPHWPLLRTVFPEEMDVRGGPLFVPARAFRKNGWARTFTTPQPDFQMSDGQPWKPCFPFLNTSYGDHLALLAQHDERRSPVLYLRRDGQDRCSTAFELAPSLEQFLLEWEKVGYVGPDIDFLGVFFGDDGKPPIQADSPKASLWRDIMSGRRTA